MEHLSLETLSIELKNVNKRIDEMVNNEKALKTLFDSKVSYKHFTWILGILITIFLAISAFIISQNNEIRSLTYGISSEISQVKIDVSQVKGKLEPYDVEFKN